MPSWDCSSSSWHGREAGICIYRISSKFCSPGMQRRGWGWAGRLAEQGGSRDSSPGHGDRSDVPAWLPGWGDAGEPRAELGVGGEATSPLCAREPGLVLSGRDRQSRGQVGSGDPGLALPRELGEHQGQPAAVPGGAGRAAEHLHLQKAWPRPRAISSWRGCEHTL